MSFRFSSTKLPTFPAGFMEIGESASEGAIGETWEEANANIEVESPLTLLDLPLIGQTYITFLSKPKTPHFSPGPESLDCQLFALEDIPSIPFDKGKEPMPVFEHGGKKYLNLSNLTLYTELAKMVKDTKKKYS